MRARRVGPRAAILGALGVAVAACQDDFPSNAYRFDPPPQYLLWWNEAEACSGTIGDLTRVRWYRTDAGVVLKGATEIAGQYNRDRHAIALAGDYVEHGGIVRHEMLHALHPRVSHPRDLFLRRCGDVVTCAGPCANEAGPAPIQPSNVRRILPTELEVSVHVTPGTPSAAAFEGHFVLVVVARNPFAEQVVVNFPDSTEIGGFRTFGFRLSEDPMGSASFYAGFPYDRSVGHFRAHESKRAVFDFRVHAPDGAGIPRPGPHYAVGSFGGKSSDTLRFTIGAPD